MTIFDQIGIRIIKEQELIIGPIAWSEAIKVNGLSVISQKSGEITISGDNKQIIDTLVSRYVRLFGRASQEVCKEATHDLITQLPKEQIPVSLM